jgi:hypothetical protein
MTRERVLDQGLLFAYIEVIAGLPIDAVSKVPARILTTSALRFSVHGGAYISIKQFESHIGLWNGIITKMQPG